MPALPALPVAANDGRYQIRSHLEILALLRALIAQGGFVSVHFGGELDFIASMLLAVDAARGTVVLDFGADPSANARLLRADTLVVRGNLDHIPVMFMAAGAREAAYGDGPALELPLPTSIVRLQRRDFYRVRVAAGRGLECELPSGEAPVVAAPTRVRVTNLSCGGMCLGEHPVIAQWRPGARFLRCRLVLPDASPLEFDIEVVRVSVTRGPRGIASGRAGVRFVDLDEGTRARLQQFVTQAEREQLATT